MADKNKQKIEGKKGPNPFSKFVSSIRSKFPKAKPKTDKKADELKSGKLIPLGARKSKPKSRFYERVAYFSPPNYKDYTRNILIQAGLEGDFTDKFVGFTISFSFGLAIAAYAFAAALQLAAYSLLIGLITGVLFFAVMNIIIVLIADSRAKEIEVVLPDALQLVAANIRAGMTIDKAIWLSARPEFGVLEEEIRKVGSKALGGETLQDALTEMAQRIRSSLLEKAVKLLIEGIQSGGEIAKLLDETSQNIRTTQSLRKEIQSAVATYSLFIVFAAVLGSPILYSVSLLFVTIITKLYNPALLSSSGGGGAPTSGPVISFSTPQVTPDELYYFALAAIGFTTFFASLLLGLIQKGNEKEGLRFMPIFMVGAFVVFFAARAALNGVFGGLFSGLN